MKNYVFDSHDQPNTGDDYSCIQCKITKRDALELIQTLASQLNDVSRNDEFGIRVMLFGDLLTLQEFESN